MGFAVFVPVCGAALTPALAADPAPGLAPDPMPAERAGGELQQTLLLEVVVNGRTTARSLISWSAAARCLGRADLAELGLRIPPGVAPVTDSLYAIASLPHVTVRVDEASQTLYVTASDGALLPRQLHVAGSPVPGTPLESALGATLNYDVTGAVTDGHAYGSGLFDMRIFSPIGVASTDLLAYAGSAGRAWQPRAGNSPRPDLRLFRLRRSAPLLGRRLHHRRPDLDAAGAPGRRADHP